MQNPVFEQVPPQRFDSWGEFETALADGPPEPDVRPRKYMMITDAGSFFPYGLGETPSDDEKQIEIDALYETSFQKAVSGGSRSDLENRWMSQGFMLIVAGVVLVLLVIIAIVIAKVLIPGSEVPPPPVP